MRVAVCQLRVTESKEENLRKAGELIEKAAVEGAEMVVLPEMFNCPYVARMFPQYAEVYPEGPTFSFLSTAAQRYGVYLVGGSVPEKDKDKACLYNASFVFDPRGKMIARHRKIHLFDVDLPGGIRVQESLTLTAGREITVFSHEWGKVGLAICYDIRFPELFRLLVQAGADAVVVPGAFNLTTGPAHWELLFRTRAVDNQIFVIGASPARDESAPYVAYGHSMIVDPWGEILARAGTGEEVIWANLERTRLEEVRARLPLLKHRRTDLYSLQWKG